MSIDKLEPFLGDMCQSRPDFKFSNIGDAYQFRPDLKFSNI